MARVVIAAVLVATAAACELPGSFTSLSLSNASLVRSNLGGQGGACDVVDSVAASSEAFCALLPPEAFGIPAAASAQATAPPIEVRRPLDFVARGEFACGASRRPLSGCASTE